MASQYLVPVSHLKGFSNLMQISQSPSLSSRLTFSPQIASAYHSNFPVIGRHISHRSHHWSRQLKIEEKLEKDRAFEDYSEHIKIIECWMFLGKHSLLGPSKVREVIETGILKLEHQPSIFAGFAGFALLYRLARLQVENQEYDFRFDDERISALIKDGMAEHMREERALKPQNPRSHIRVDGFVINDDLWGTDNGFTLKTMSDNEGYLIYTGDNTRPLSPDHWRPPLYILCFKDVKSVSWPASKESQREVTVMMMNGDEIKLRAYQREEAEQLAWELKHFCGL